jgi:hypothetical protein
LEENKSKLEQLQALLNEADLKTNVIKAGPNAPLETLLIGLSSLEENDDRDWQLELSFVPGYAEKLENTELLQFFVCLTDRVAPTAHATLEKLLTAYNTQIPLGAFGFFKHQNLLYFRHVTLINKDDDLEDTLPEMIWMLSHVLTQYSNAALAGATGTYSAEEIFSKIGL